MAGLFGKFMALPAARQGALVEAVIALAAARLAVRTLPARWYVPRGGGAPAASDPAVARRIRWAVLSAAHRVPWNAVCLPQALAAQWMLRRRGIESVMHVGLGKDESGKHMAHAWLHTNDRQGNRLLVTGDGDLTRYTELGAFRL